MATTPAISDPLHIERVKLQKPSISLVPAKAEPTVFEEAKAILGYHHPFTVKRSTQLRDAMVAAEIDPLNTEQVEAYMASKETKPRTYYEGSYWERRKGTLSAMGGILLANAIGQPLICLIHNPDARSFLQILSVIASTIALILLGSVGLFHEKTHLPSLGQNLAWKKLESSMVWERFELRSYSDLSDHFASRFATKRFYAGFIPEHVLCKAVALRKALPQVSFEVLELSEKITDVGQREAELLALADPFLLARYGEESYYIDVWDERDFERDSRNFYADEASMS